jgi:phosphoenolpyruvate carboxykinase (ATP)
VTRKLSVSCASFRAPLIRAIKKSGFILENVVLKKATNEVDLKMFLITPNTRVSYPIYHIDNIQLSSIGKILKTYFPYCRFIWNITSNFKINRPSCLPLHLWLYCKSCRNWSRVTEPQPNFSACFGAPFMPLHPTRYAEMLSKKIRSRCESLVNKYWMDRWSLRTGSRMNIRVPWLLPL